MCADSACIWASILHRSGYKRASLLMDVVILVFVRTTTTFFLVKYDAFYYLYFIQTKCENVKEYKWWLKLIRIIGSFESLFLQDFRKKLKFHGKAMFSPEQFLLNIEFQF